MASAALLCTACGTGTFIELRVQSRLAIPSEVDSLRVQALDPSDEARLLLDREAVLAASESFPITVILEPVDTSPQDVIIDVIALLEDNELTGVRATGRFEQDVTTRIEVTLP
ncbi:MAG: hypothetical protein AAF654_00390 [Myxococcota bacterium]